MSVQSVSLPRLDTLEQAQLEAAMAATRIEAATMQESSDVDQSTPDAEAGKDVEAGKDAQAGKPVPEPSVDSTTRCPSAQDPNSPPATAGITVLRGNGEPLLSATVDCHTVRDLRVRTAGLLHSDFPAHMVRLVDASGVLDDGTSLQNLQTSVVHVVLLPPPRVHWIFLGQINCGKTKLVNSILQNCLEGFPETLQLLERNVLEDAAQPIFIDLDPAAPQIKLCRARTDTLHQEEQIFETLEDVSPRTLEDAIIDQGPGLDTLEQAQLEAAMAASRIEAATMQESSDVDQSTPDAEAGKDVEAGRDAPQDPNSPHTLHQEEQIFETLEDVSPRRLEDAIIDQGPLYRNVLTLPLRLYTSDCPVIADFPGFGGPGSVYPSESFDLIATDPFFTGSGFLACWVVDLTAPLFFFNYGLEALRFIQNESETGFAPVIIFNKWEELLRKFDDPKWRRVHSRFQNAAQIAEALIGKLREEMDGMRIRSAYFCAVNAFDAGLSLLDAEDDADARSIQEAKDGVRNLVHNLSDISRGNLAADGHYWLAGPHELRQAWEAIFNQ